MTFFCHLPWTAILSPEAGLATPCCVFKGAYDLDTYVHNPNLIKVKQKLLQGQTPKECQNCADAESRTGHSFRLLHKTFKSELHQMIKEKNDAEFFAINDLSLITSGICNLKCLPCFNGSYIRMLELKNLGLLHIEPVQRPYNVVTLLNNESLLKDLDLITITGGEPFYDKVTFEFLQKFTEKIASHKQVSVHINTNLTNITQPHLDFLADNFNDVIIKASIDGIGSVNDYLRYPSDWSKIIENFDLIQQDSRITMVITSTVSNLSLLKMHEVIQFCIDKKINLFFTTVSSPEILRPDILPDRVKQELLITYQNLKKQYSGKIFDRTETCIDTAISMCQKPNSTEFTLTDTIAWCKKHDQIRNTDLFNVFPEIRQWA